MSSPAPPEKEAATNRGDTVQSVVRCFSVLEALLDESDRGATTAQLALRTALPRPVVRRLLLTMRQLGYVEDSGPRWHLTPRILNFGGRYSEAAVLIRVCRPHLAQVAGELDETTVLGQLHDGMCRLLAGTRPDHHSAAHLEVGAQLPVHSTAAGHVLLAWLDDVPPVPLVRHTEHTIATRHDLLQRLKQVRADGFAVAIEELEIGLGAAAAPIRDATGSVIGAINTAVPLGRRTPQQIRDEIVPVLLRAADEIAADLRRADLPN